MAYAAKQYLKNQGQLTVVRLLGSSTGVPTDNGWSIFSSSRASVIARTQLRAVLRTTSAGVTRVEATAVGGNTRITSYFTGGSIRSRSADVSFLPTDSNYIGRVFPTSRRNVRTTGGDPINVGVTYGLYVDMVSKDVTLSANSATAVLFTGQVAGNSYLSRQSPVVVSQGYGPSGSATVYELFKVVNRGQGSGTNTDVKIQISNIIFDDTKDFPDFFVNVRKFSDTDQSRQVLQSFRVNLDPQSDDFILKIIGDRYQKIVTDQGATPFIKTYGDWDNKSDYIRIAHPDATDAIFVKSLPVVPSNARPQGFKGINIGNTIVNSNGNWVPNLQYVDSQKRRVNVTDASPTGDVSKKITLGWDFARNNSSILKSQNYFSTSAHTFSTNLMKGFYIQPSNTDRTPSTGSYQIRAIHANGTDISSTLIAGGNSNNVKFAFPLYAGRDGWDLNTNDTSQEQVMNGDHATRVNNAIDVFANADEIDVNMLAIPGLGSGNNGQQINRAIDLCDERGDCFFVADLAKESSAASATVDDAIDTTISECTDQADGFDSSYAATFWPWIRVKDANTNDLVWVPSSVAAYSVIAYNDRVAHPWFAAAGFKRGLLDFAVEARLKLTKDHRDDLYEANVNPIATIKDQILIFGNKTLQAKRTALQGLDVRRGMIDLKKLVASVAQFVLFDKNTIRSRDELVGRVTPILQTMQSQDGLNAFRVQSNPSDEEIDRNELPVTIFVQFTRTAEFIPIDFVITRTGVQF